MFDFRMKTIAPILSAMALLSIAPSMAMAAESEGVKASAAETDANGHDKLICRRVEAIGTRLKAGRVCMTSQQWAAKRQEDRDALQRGQTQRWKSE